MLKDFINCLRCLSFLDGCARLFSCAGCLAKVFNFALEPDEEYEGEGIKNVEFLV